MGAGRRLSVHPAEPEEDEDGIKRASPLNLFIIIMTPAPLSLCPLSSPPRRRSAEAARATGGTMMCRKPGRRKIQSHFAGSLSMRFRLMLPGLLSTKRKMKWRSGPTRRSRFSSSSTCTFPAVEPGSTGREGGTKESWSGSGTSCRIGHGSFGSPSRRFFTGRWPWRGSSFLARS